MKSRVGMWYAVGPADETFTAGDPDWNVHTVVSDGSEFPDHVTVENGGGQRFPVAISLIDDIAEQLSTHPIRREP
ncbi:MAG: hypothetical protein WCE63_17885 [Acidobacteriaceae bacterium]